MRRKGGWLKRKKSAEKSPESGLSNATEYLSNPNNQSCQTTASPEGQRARTARKNI
jgi:hypothetical protein